MIKLILWMPLFASLVHAQRWKMQFLHDEDNSRIVIQDLAFPSETTGVACGVLQMERSAKGIVLLTRDGGKAWNRVDVQELPVSLQFLNESLGFMVTNKGLWKTEERGLAWKKLKSWTSVSRVHFVDAARGFAVGPNRTFLSTGDGGKTWEAVAEGKKVSALTNFYWIAFKDQLSGIALGSSAVARRRAAPLPEFIDPEGASKEREWPHLAATLETRDGGKTWAPQTAPVFGTMRKVRFVPDGVYGLSILQYEHSFEVPSEAYLFNSKTGKSESTYRAPGRYVEDIAFLGPGAGLLAVIERPGKLMQSPIPGKLRILSAANLRTWMEIPVDYRASGSRAILAVVDERHAWVALDTGMILRLEP